MKHTFYILLVALVAVFAAVSCKKPSVSSTNTEQGEPEPGPGPEPATVTNSVVLDGVVLPITGAITSRTQFIDEGIFGMNVYYEGDFSSNSRVCMTLYGDRHFGKTIDLTAREPVLDNTGWSIFCMKLGNILFKANGIPSSDEGLFTSGTLNAERLDDSSDSPVVKIEIKDGVICDNKYGDKAEHTFYMHYQGSLMLL